jgi:hypothetical protein
VDDPFENQDIVKILTIKAVKEDIVITPIITIAGINVHVIANINVNAKGLVIASTNVHNK